MKKQDSITGKFIATHGKSFTSEYRSWTAMKKRCLNPDDDHMNYKNIPICKEWVDSFQKFIDDMGSKPSPKHTIERVDNTKGYYPENCKWATRSEQNRNYSQNRVIEFRGQRKCVTEWSEETGIHRHRIYQRLNKGWSIENALTIPVKH